jgi:cobalt/nickel transport system permease protein
MHLPETDPRRRTSLHRAPPGAKLIAALLLIAGTVLLPRRPDVLYLVPTGILVFFWAWSRMPAVYALQRLLVIQFFILGVALLSLFGPAGLSRFLGTVAKSNLCVFAMLLLTWTTPFQEILQGLRHLRMPSVMLTVLALMYRYLPVLTEESRRMQRARASRTFDRSRRRVWHSLSIIIGQLFIRSANRAERIYLAMCARGWK